MEMLYLLAHSGYFKAYVQSLTGIEMEQSRKKTVNVHEATLSIERDSNMVLNTILDVLVDMHLDGKPEPEQGEYREKVKQRLIRYNKEAFELMGEIRR